MQNNPWVEEIDPIREYYNTLDKVDMELVHQVLSIVDLDKAIFNLNLDFCTNKTELLDFSDYYGKNYQFELFKQLINDVPNKNGNLYWIPLNPRDYSHNQYVFEEYEPLMIAKTPIGIDYIDKISLSMIQMISGAYLVFDDSLNFILIIIDGFYATALVDGCQSENYSVFIDNWNRIEANLDDSTSKFLLENRSVTKTI